MKRILIFNVNWLGDVLFSTATIRNIRRNFHNSFLACIIPSRCYPILKGNPYLDEIIIFDEKDRHKGLLAKLRFIRFLKTKRFDTVFLLHRSFSRALICCLAGIPERIGYYTKKRGFLLTKKIMAPRLNSLHRIDYYLNIIEKAGLKIEDRYLEFFISEEDHKFIDDFLSKNFIEKDIPLRQGLPSLYELRQDFSEALAKENFEGLSPKLKRKGDDFLVAINPGGNWLPKRWPKDYWAQLADRLISEFKAKVIITGSHTDIKDARDIKDLMKAKPIIASGVFNLKQLGALCKRIDLFITSDTGPLHIANTVGTKRIVALFGPTSPEITGPYPLKSVIILRKDVGCRIPCYVVDCRDNRCMKAITPEEVIEQIRLLKVP